MPSKKNNTIFILLTMPQLIQGQDITFSKIFGQLKSSKDDGIAAFLTAEQIYQECS